MIADDCFSPSLQKKIEAKTKKISRQLLLKKKYKKDILRVI